ncbi:MAG: prolyl aminopeptidase [Candidatus Thiodiazotropha taylori]|nr:prolyl aminopeptidase [Candidatus Thiodiazotropha taylori]MCG7944612.1 prolyl aminopeptidase [Candidatus Thiodiazotropha taylori]MCG7973950.1 prolyl aminopeptidase [Candidatus Thiodiazotropha taylori]MCG7994864.1 prolyl aminopeptidase [Candidatus Thiodiazotropha taylori]MCG8037196.1 prolyl aminopeptidase [Candidatus Thiodiazotropha taylori]
MNDLYPAIEPYKTQRLAVDAQHHLYIEEVGNPAGIPALFLHGGPGAGCEPYHRQFFDPELYRVVLFDQRGSGRSTPHASLQDNTTWDLVEDIERIREALKIEKWLLFGGSWGSTLALAYAQAHPERVTALVLRGIFLCRDQEIEWFYQQGASWVFPDYWQDFVAPIPQHERENLLHAYYRRLTGDDEISRMATAKAWSVWEGRTSSLLTNPSVVGFFSDPHTALSLARIEAHYFVNHAFLRPDQLLKEATQLAGIPGTIVQGRYDLICPMKSAWELHQAWPDSELKVVADAGHSATETGIRSALVEATQHYARLLG